MEILSPPVAEFELVFVDLAGGLTGLPAGPQIVLFLDGEIAVASDTGSVRLPRGSAAFVSGTEAAVNLSGDGRVAIGRPPL